MIKRKLTGKRRYRQQTIGTAGLIVLQVEETYMDSKYVGGSVDVEWVKEWRDANVGDITEFVEETV